MKFKVGDKVKVIQMHPHYNTKLPIGHVGRITKVWTNEFSSIKEWGNEWYNVDGHPKGGMNFQSECFVLYGIEIKKEVCKTCLP